MNRELKELLAIVDAIENEFMIVTEVCENVKRLTEDFSENSFLALMSTVIDERYGFTEAINATDLKEIITKNLKISDKNAN